ncbi:MAG TPA: PfkB family carbohydrate kinase [Vicinamibacterales bacterium]|nr:PfkB family carbohydrate kinase [Vicinamibacterales bacterium]
MDPILAVGSVAFDSIKTPFGEAAHVVGGSATFFSVAASFFTDVRMVGVVGEDFGDDEMRVFAGRRIDLEGLERVPGETFRWKGEYGFDLNSRETIYTRLNAFEGFQPKIPERYRASPLVFLGNIQPALQADVLDQVRAPRLVAADTMNLWIEHARADLERVLRRVDVLIINDSEARELAGHPNLVRAAQRIQAMGPRILVIKRGEHGVLMTRPDDGGFFAAPAMPLDTVFDPTGAGDTFAGGFVGSLAASGELTDAAFRRATIYGSALASFSVEDFGLNRLLTLSRGEIDARMAEFKRLTHFDVR